MSPSHTPSACFVYLSSGRSGKSTGSDSRGFRRPPTRIDITDEFVRAITVQKLDYRTLKNMVRASLEHSFLAGKSLWEVRSHYDRVAEVCAHDEPGDPRPSPACAQLLAVNERAAMQWKLEAQFHAFEHSIPPWRGSD